MLPCDIPKTNYWVELKKENGKCRLQNGGSSQTKGDSETRWLGAGALELACGDASSSCKTPCATLGKWPNPAVPQLPHLQHKVNNCVSSEGLLWRLNEPVFGNLETTEQCLIQNSRGRSGRVIGEKEGGRAAQNNWNKTNVGEGSSPIHPAVVMLLLELLDWDHGQREARAPPYRNTAAALWHSAPDSDSKRENLRPFRWSRDTWGPKGYCLLPQCCFLCNLKSNHITGSA